MKREKTIYVCSQCGKEYSRWVGKCQECNSWGSIAEEIRITDSKTKSAHTSTPAEAIPLSDVAFNRSRDIIASGIGEVDRVLGGGFFKKSLTLLSGGPGIGKSTLMLQIADRSVRNNEKVLYISAEESAEQIRERAERLQVDTRMLISNEDRLDAIVSLVESTGATVVVVDSVQTIYDPSLDSLAGTVSQVRQAALRLRECAHSLGIAIILIGHVTKVGSIAGPMVLEHMVDTVLFFEGDDRNFWRILRSTKNRFGSTQEIGVFSMDNNGLSEIANPSAFFLEDGHLLSGSVTVTVMEGVRPIFLEIQALVSRSYYAIPQRVAHGIDAKALSIILAVLEKRLNYEMGKYDVFVNVVGGISIKETSAGLGIALALVSSLLDRPLPSRTVVMGEVGLSGELRKVPFTDRRIDEACKLGFTQVILPEVTKSAKTSVGITTAATLNDIISKVFV